MSTDALQYKADRETEERMIRKGEMSNSGIADDVPSLPLEEL